MKNKILFPIFIFLFLASSTLILCSCGKAKKKKEKTVEVLLQENIENSLKSALEDNLKLTSENEEFKKKLTDLENYSKGLALVNDGMRSENDALRAQGEKLKDAQAKNLEFEQKIQVLNKQIDKSRNEVLAANKSIERLKNENNNLSGQLKDNFLFKQNAECAAELENLQSKNREAVNSMAKALKDMQAYQMECALTHYNLGWTFFKDKDYRRAIEEFKRSVTLNPKNADAYYNLGILYDDYLGDNNAAVACYEKNLEILTNAKNSKNLNLIDKVKKKMLEAKLREKARIASSIDKTLR